jgi:hypothetical protein
MGHLSKENQNPEGVNEPVITDCGIKRINRAIPSAPNRI